jgi:aminopeptidase N
MVVVQADFPDGMEFSGLVFVGGEYFRGFLGDPASYLTIITAHEVSHQWWYGKVGNDQALSPWLDEALATYSEYLFIEEYYPQLKEWWWWFRVDHLEPEGYVDSTVYEFPTIRAYINAVYLRGVRMLHALRSDLGTEAFFDWLHHYADSGAGQVVTPELLWSLLTPEQWQLTSATRQVYLRQPHLAYLQNP